VAACKLRLTGVTGSRGFETRGILFEAYREATFFKNGVSDRSSHPRNLRVPLREKENCIFLIQ
jgi:hypothetical protein